MAKSVGPVNIKVGMNAAGAYTEINKVENRMKRLQRTARNVSRGAGGGLSRFAFGVAGALPGGGLISAGAAGPAGVMLALSTAIISQTRAAAAAIDANAKLADKLNISTTALTGLQHAADLTGTSQEALSKGLSFLQRALGQAAQGNAAQVQALGQLGLTYQEIAHLTPDQQFGLVADRLNQITDVNERAALSAQLFGRGFQNMGNLLRAGSKGIEAMSAEAEKLGLVVSRQDAALVEKMNDEWTKLTKSMQGFANQLTVTLAPALTEVFMAITEATSSMAALVQVARAFSGVRLEGTTQNLAMIIRGLSLFDRTGVLTNIANQLAAVRPVSAASQVGGTVQAVARLEATIGRGFDGLEASLQSQIAQLSGRSFEQQLDSLQSQVQTQIQGITAQAQQANQLAQQAINQLSTLPGGAGIPLMNQLFQMQLQTSANMAKQAESLQFQANIRERILRNENTQLQLLRQRNELEQQAARIIQQFESPLTAFQNRLVQINQLQARGLLTGTTASLATASAFQQLADSLPQASATGPEALQAGSVAAQAAINRFNRQGPAVNLTQQIRDAVRRAVEVQQQQLAEAREIRRALGGLGPIAPAGLAP